MQYEACKHKHANSYESIYLPFLMYCNQSINQLQKGLFCSYEMQNSPSASGFISKASPEIKLLI